MKNAQRAPVVVLALAILLSGCGNDLMAPPPLPQASWELIATGEKFVDVWATDNEAFALGAHGTLLHFDGSSWTHSIGPAGTAIWGTSRDNVFLTTSGRAIYHYDGQEWEVVHIDALDRQFNDIWGSSSENIFAVGYAGVIVRYDGDKWTETPSGTDKRLTAVWGSSANDVYAVGVDGTVLHYDGNSWTQLRSGTELLWGVWSSSPSDVYAVFREGVLHYDGTAWTRVLEYDVWPLAAIWGSSATDIYVVGEDGTVLNWDGVAWAEIHGQDSDLTAVSGSSSQDIFVVGGGNVYDSTDGSIILHSDGAGWERQATDLLHESWGYLGGVDGTSDTDILFIGHWQRAPIFRRFDGNEFNARLISSQVGTDMGTLRDICVASTDKTVFVTESAGNVGRLSGTRFGWWPLGSPGAVWAASSTSVFATQDDDLQIAAGIYHFDGAAWSPTMTAGEGESFGVQDIWGTSETDVFAVGRNGTAYHYGDSGWVETPTGTSQTLRGVWGTSGINVFAVGDGGTILKYDGSVWNSVDSPTTKGLRSVWGMSPDHIYAVGSAVVLRFDGTRWTIMSDSIGGYDIWGSSSGHLYIAAGDRVWHYRP